MSDAVVGGHLAHDECSLTRYPNLCAETLMELGSGNHNVDNVVALVNKTIFETNLPSSYFAEFRTEDAHLAHSVVADYCEELMSMSLKRLDQSLRALTSSPRRNYHDIQTWLSASLTFQQSCKDHVHAHTTVFSADNLLQKMFNKMDYLSQLGSNSLALVNMMSTTSNHKLNEKEQEFPHWVSTKGRKLLQGGTIKANAVVAQDGSGNYKTVSEAIEAASGARFVIYVKKGVYKEKIRTNKDGITLIGDGKYSTLIVGDDSVAKGASMPDTATFTITGDGFFARDIGFQNNAGPEGQQAIALNIVSDHSVLYRCSIAVFLFFLMAGGRGAGSSAPVRGKARGKAVVTGRGAAEGKEMPPPRDSESGVLGYNWVKREMAKVVLLPHLQVFFRVTFVDVDPLEDGGFYFGGLPRFPFYWCPDPSGFHGVDQLQLTPSEAAIVEALKALPRPLDCKLIMLLERSAHREKGLEGIVGKDLWRDLKQRYNVVELEAPRT
ncbi:probable pectinesterase/pectinesterase inhibitor 54 [Cajanus cajan]|uniref:probable pectinesterase/pectinesterase inhibitor 54 n=1 Tax=Cajanus cajan TaxID=3821 RepID=UPI0010FAEBD5|nr:probable pectinesterase/pectinesterase inhibitor 54 [Cajanus cajan]